jgi:adenylate cyclase
LSGRPMGGEDTVGNSRRSAQTYLGFISPIEQPRILTDIVDLEFFEKLAPGCFTYGMTCVVEFEPHSLWPEVSLAIAKQALGRKVKTEYHVFQHTPAEIRLKLERMGVEVEEIEREGLFRVMDSYTPTTPLASPTEGIRESLISGRTPDAGQWARAIQDKMKTGFEEEEKRWLHIDDNESVLLEFSDEESIMNGWRTTFVPMAKARELLIMHALVKGVASDSFYRKTEAMADAVIDISAKEEGGRLENYVRLRVLRGMRFDSGWHRIELTSSGDVAVEAARSEEPRRLAAIMFTDMVGFTALTQSNETQSLEVLDRHNRLLRPFFPKFHGREVKAIGDSFLVEFDSALDATNCAIEIQRFLHDYNISSRDEWKITLRIGVHLGDVVHREGDVFGDAVNIASRLQPLAEPEGVCVSDPVFGQVRNKLPQNFVKMVSQDLKNIRFPMDVYKVIMPWEQGRRAQSVVTSKPSLDANRIAVLPLTNMSPDPNDEFFADGMTEEIISAISKLKGTEVISRTSVMQYKKTPKPLKEVSMDLEAGTILEGSFRKAGNRVRITVQMIDATRDRHLWAQNYDRTLDDIFAVQSEIAENVAGELKVQLLESEKETLEKKPTENTEAYSDFLRGRELYREATEPSMRQALALFEKSVELDSSFARAYVGVAECHQWLANVGYEPRDVMLPIVKASLKRTLDLDPDLAEAHASLAVLHLFEDDLQGTESEAKRALELNPSLPEAYHMLYEVAGIKGKPEDMVKYIETAYRLDPVRSNYVYGVGLAYLDTGREQDALEHWRKTEHLAQAQTYRAMTDYYLSKGDIAKARELHAKFAKLQPTHPWVTYMGGFIDAQAGEREKALQAIKKIEEANMSPVALNFMAYVYHALGDMDSYFDYMNRALEAHVIIAVYVLYSPLLAKAREDPRYKELVEKLRKQAGLAK